MATQTQTSASSEQDLSVEKKIQQFRGLCHVWTYMDPARLQRVWQTLVQGSQLLTYIRLPYAA